DAAVDLGLDEHVVQHRAAVVDGDVADEARIAGLDVHLHDRDVASEREGLVALVELRARLERSELGPRQRPRGHAPDPEAAAAQVLDVIARGLEPPRRLVLRLLDELDADLAHRAAAELQRPRARGPEAGGDGRGVALDHGDRLRRDAEQSGGQLRVRGHVALARGHRADADGHPAFGVDARVRGLRRVEHRGHLHVAADADAELHAVAALAARGLVAAQRLVAGGL